MSKMIKKILGILGVLGIVAAFAMPSLYFRWEDTKTFNRRYCMSSIDYRLESKSEDITQVATIYTLYNDSASFVNYPESYVQNGENKKSYEIIHYTSSSENGSIVVSSTGPEGDIPDDGAVIEDENRMVSLAMEQLEQLKDIGVLRKNTWSQVQVSRVRLTVTNDDYIYIKWGSDTRYLGVILDKKTEKIIMIEDASGGEHSIPDRKVYEEYVHYLGLDIMSDWHIEGLMMVSPTAELKITSLQENDVRKFYILPARIPLLHNREYFLQSE